MPLVFAQPDPAPEKPRSWLRKAFTADHVTRAVWAALGVLDQFNGFVAIIGNHPFSAAIDLTAAVYMFLLAWNPQRTAGWIRAGVIHAIRGIRSAWKLCAPLAARAATVPYTRLSDRYGLYGKTLRMRARIRRLKHKMTRR